MSGKSYVGRALLELLMVFLGVMGAFFVDDWRAGREDRAMEVQYLQRLAADLQGDSATMAGSWTRAVERKQEAMRVVGRYVRGQTREIGDTLDFVHNVGLAGSGGFTAWAFSTPTMDDLKSTGNLRVIVDPDLREAIVEHYRFLDTETARIQGRLPIYPMAVHAVLPAEARDDIDMPMLREWNIERALAHIRSDAFQDTFNQESNSVFFQAAVLPGIQASTNDLLVRIRAELERLGER